MSSSQKTPLQKFCVDFFNLVDEITEMMISAKEMGMSSINLDMLNGIIGILKQTNQTTLIKNYIVRSSEHWEELFDQDEQFFEEHMFDIFKGPMVNDNLLKKFEGIRHQTNSDGERYLEDEDIDLLWSYLEALTVIAFEYLEEPGNLDRANCWLVQADKPKIDLVSIKEYYQQAKARRS